ncbi:MAG: hypothetical protein GY849_20240, partial [Deltaproteobacteria bacterium]|nr:hypothetical protein [Deltaproteobacteria bacterium]
ASLLGRMQRAAKALQEQGFRFTSGLPDRVRDIIKEIQPVESPERGPEEARDRFKSKERGAKEAREISFKEQDHPVSGVEEERHPLKRVEERGRLLEDHKESMTGSDDLFTDSDEIYIDNAGLVLLWPFLERFFENMGLMKARRFISLDLAKRGALMLQFLADGATEAPESAIPLNKVLCGIDMEEPVET